MTEIDFETQPLCQMGEHSNRAYLIKEGRVVVSSDLLSPHVIEVPNLLAGVAEFFLSHGSSFPDRLFNLSVEKESQLIGVSFETVREMAENFEFGESANRFLAHLLQITNGQIRKLQGSLPTFWKTYQDRAKAYAGIVNELLSLYRKSGLVEYQRIAEKCRKDRIYVEGQLLFQSQSLTAVEIDTVPMEERIQKFPAKSIICRNGDKADCLFVLLKGEIAVLQRDKYITSISQSGEAFGELSLFLEGKRTADLVAQTEISLFQLKKQELKQFHETHPRVFAQMARTLAGRLQANIEQMRLLKEVVNGSAKKNQDEGQLGRDSAQQLKDLVDSLIKLRRIGSRPELNKLMDRYRKERVISSLYE